MTVTFPSHDRHVPVTLSSHSRHAQAALLKRSEPLPHIALVSELSHGFVSVKQPPQKLELFVDGAQRAAEGGKGWQRVAEGGRGWQRVAEGGRGWQRVAVGDVVALHCYTPL